MWGQELLQPSYYHRFWFLRIIPHHKRQKRGIETESLVLSATKSALYKARNTSGLFSYMSDFRYYLYYIGYLIELFLFFHFFFFIYNKIKDVALYGEIQS